MWNREKTEDQEVVRAFLRSRRGPALRLSGGTRMRILRQSLEARSGESTPATGRQPALALAAAAAAFLILAAGFLASVPGLVPSGSPGFAERSDGPTDIWLDYQNGQVVLTWAGAGRDSFAVRQGSRLPEARRAPAVIVEGQRYVTNLSPAPKEAVFYVVE